jgi:hypothetical protein
LHVSELLKVYGRLLFLKLDATGLLDLFELPHELLAYPILPIIDYLGSLPGFFDWWLRRCLFFTESRLARSLIEGLAADLIIQFSFLFTRIVDLIQG